MKMTIESAAGRVKRPSTSSMPPIVSVQPTSVPQNMPGLITETFEQRGVGVEAHAAEHAEQFLTAVRYQDDAEAGAQERQHKRFKPGVEIAERRNVIA